MTAGADLDPQALRPAPIAHATVAVPLDGSTFAVRALGVARWAADHLGARLQLVEVVDDPAGVAPARTYLASMAAPGESYDVCVDEDPAEALAAVVGFGDGVLACMSSHGRGRAAALGSVAAHLLHEVDQPVLLVGPDAVAPADGAPVVVAVDGRESDDELVPVALGWARSLARRLVIVTVIEPAPPTFDADHPAQRSIGPLDARGDEAALVARCAGSGVPVEAVVVEDPVSLRAGLHDWLARQDPALVVCGTHRRTGVARVVHGDPAAGLVHVAPGPVLAVPLGLRT